MHTAEIEHHPHAELHPLAQRLPFLRGARFMRSEDTVLANLGAWTIGLVLFTLAGFYIGTIAGHDNHANQMPNAGPSIVTSAAPPGTPWRVPGEAIHRDLNPDQLQMAIPFAIAGLIIGLIFALWISFGYTPAKLRELDAEHVPH